MTTQHRRTPLQFGFEIGTGSPVSIPMAHMVVTGITQQAGKTTALEALVTRAGVKAIAFLTKRGEGAFANQRVIAPYFRERADWQFVAAILEASRGEKMRMERAWIIRAAKGARTLADVHRNVKRELEKAKSGFSADMYLVLDAYLEAVVPQIETVRWADRVDLRPGINVMDLTGLTVEMQHLVLRSTIEWVLEREAETVVLVPEAWKFIPQGRGTPVKLAAEAFIRQAAGLHNFLWLDSQDIAGVEKMILKSVPVWILGVQRESNEVKRTLAQIPAGVKKPKPEDIATLDLGQFIVCYGTHTVRAYAQPAWMDAPKAHQIATGVISVHSVDAPARNKPTPIEEDTVTEKEARQLREQNAELQKENGELRRRLDALERVHLDATNERAGAPRAGIAASGERIEADLITDRLYEAIKKRLSEEAPRLLRVLAEKPELVVKYTRPIIEVDGDSLRGRIARLIADGFYDRGATAPGTQKELARRGGDPGPANTYKELDSLATLGFLTIEQGRDERSRPRKEYHAVKDMKVNVVERDD